MMNMMKMMQQAGKMKKRMQEMQEKVKEQTVVGEVANGAVKVTMDGGFKVREVKLEKSVVNPADVELLEDMIVSALADAHQKASGMIESESKKVFKELGLPENLDLPF